MSKFIFEKYKENLNFILNIIIEAYNKYVYSYKTICFEKTEQLIITQLQFHSYENIVICFKNKNKERENESISYSINDLIINEKTEKINILKIKNKTKSNKLYKSRLVDLEQNMNKIKFCSCTCCDTTIFDYLYKKIMLTNMNIFKLTMLEHKSLENIHYNNYISIISKYKLQFKQYVINIYSLENYKKKFVKR